MKHIKDFKIFESKAILTNEDFLNIIKNDVEDMLLEVSDIGYTTYYDDINPDWIMIDIYKMYEPGNNYTVKTVEIKLDDIKDCVNRIIEYMSSKELFIINLYLRDKHDTKIEVFKDLDLSKVLIEVMATEVFEYHSVYSLQIECLKNYEIYKGI